MPVSIFISYRRSDAGGHAGRLYDRLSDRFDRAALFYDLEHIDGGERFPDRIRQAVGEAAVVLVLIGPDWLEEVNRRVQLDEVDFVRCEVELALQRESAPQPATIIPVLLGGLQPPTEAGFDAAVRATLAPLCGLNMHVFQGTNDDWNRQFERLCERITRTTGQRIPGAVPRHPVAKPQLRRLKHGIFGRDDVVGFFLDRFDAGTRDFAFEYMAGVGKTTAAEQLVRSEAVMARFPDGALWADIGKSADESMLGRELEKWATVLGVASEALAQARGPAERSELVAAAIGDRALLLVVDDVWSEAAAEPFMVGGPACARVVTTRQRALAKLLLPSTGVVRTLDTLDTEDALRLLTEIAPNAARHEPEGLRRLAEQVDGLPIALGLIGRMLKQEGDKPDRIRRALASLDLFGTDDLPRAIEASFDALGASLGASRDASIRGDLLRRAVESLSILRPDPAWFDRALAQTVTEVGDAELDEVLDDLCDAGLIEELDLDPAAGTERRFTMHRVIAEYLRQKPGPAAQRRELSRRAALRCFESLRRLEERRKPRGGTSYSSWYRYEDGEWLDAQDNWLYYVAQAGEGEQADIAFLRAWFDGFWWWASFTDEGFGFCHQLLRSWDERLRQAAPGGSAQEAQRRRRLDAIALLRRFQAAYRSANGSGTGDAWSEVAATLREIRSLAGLDRAQPAALAPDMRHVRGLTDIFLAEAARFGEQKPEVAEQHYREALALFRSAADDWNCAWLGYHLADLLCDLRRFDEARALCVEALPLGRREADGEVVANLHRVLGDIGRSEGEWPAAVRDYHQAVLEACRFQIEPEPPDAYTVRFYAGMVETVARHLLPLQSSEAGRASLRSLHRTWSRCTCEAAASPTEALLTEAATAEQLAANMFLPALPVAQLAREGARYADRVSNCLAALGDRAP